MLLPQFPDRGYRLRVVAASLTLALALSSPAFALRSEQKKEHQSGLEEIRLALEGDPDRLLKLASATLGFSSSSVTPTAIPPAAVSSRAAAGAEERWEDQPEIRQILERVPENVRERARQVVQLAQSLASENELPLEDQQSLRIAAAQAFLPDGGAGRSGNARLDRHIADIRGIAQSITEMETSPHRVAKLVLSLDEKVRRREISLQGMDMVLGNLGQLIGPARSEMDQAFLERSRYFKEYSAMFRLFIQEARIQTKKEILPVHVRWMIRRDMPEVLHVEQQSFKYAWIEEDFLRCLRQRNCIGMVAESGEKVVGFMIYELHKKRKLHLLNFAVHPAYRRQDVGGALIRTLWAKPSAHRKTRITLEVRETNLPAQLFFRSMGFRVTRVLRNYYEDSGEEAFRMEFNSLNEGSEEEREAAAQEPPELPGGQFDPDAEESLLEEEGGTAVLPEEGPDHGGQPPRQAVKQPELALDEYPDIRGDEPAVEPTPPLIGPAEMSERETEAAAGILNLLEQNEGRRWTKQDFETALQADGVTALSLRDQQAGNALAAFAVFRAKGFRRSILSFAVAPQYKGKGIGQLLLNLLKEKGYLSDGVAYLEVRIRETDAQAREFFLGEGFEFAGPLLDFFDQPKRDAYLLQWSGVIRSSSEGKGAGAEERQAAGRAVQEQADGLRSWMDPEWVPVIGRRLAQELPALQVWAGLEERVLIEKESPEETVARAAGKGNAIYFLGGLEEAEALRPWAQRARMEFAAVDTHGRKWTLPLILERILSRLGVPTRIIQAGLANLAAGLEEIAFSA